MIKIVLKQIKRQWTSTLLSGQTHYFLTKMPVFVAPSDVVTTLHSHNFLLTFCAIHPFVQHTFSIHRYNSSTTPPVLVLQGWFAQTCAVISSVTFYTKKKRQQFKKKICLYASLLHDHTWYYTCCLHTSMACDTYPSGRLIDQPTNSLWHQ